MILEIIYNDRSESAFLSLPLNEHSNIGFLIKRREGGRGSIKISCNNLEYKIKFSTTNNFDSLVNMVREIEIEIRNACARHESFLEIDLKKRMR
ncbi:hypothetical protein [uncultured Helicobacter sp.]|uniref:hypothetical protein n=1 Tax=uncultured Helicobacter sp. TaxID=175537 RepID=UPI00260CB64B|nr:hypothetical protein [uncultured Helicobacter sp.]